MTTVSDDLDFVQSRLQDGEQLWMRDELLRYYNDGYRQLLSKSAAITRLTILDVPGRFSYSICYEWEDRATNGGTFNKFTYSCKNSTMQSTYLWEAQAMDGVTTVNSQPNATQLWEISVIGTIDNHFRFALPKSHDHIKRITYDDELLLPIAVRELDWSDRIWFRAPGEPRWWTSGVGRNGTFEIYEIRTDYNQGYALQQFENGIPRQLSGSRTYSVSLDGFDQKWTVESGPFTFANTTQFTVTGDQRTTYPVGYDVRVVVTAGTLISYITQSTYNVIGNATTITLKAGILDSGLSAVSVGTYFPGTGCIRSISSPDREYIPMMSGAAPDLMYGSIRDWRSSVKSVMVTETVIPDMALTEDDAPGLLPKQMNKYLRYYTLATAYGKEGEGKRPDLAEHYMMRFKRGIQVMSRIAWISQMDRVYLREEITETVVRPPRVRLPVHYPVVNY